MEQANSVRPDGEPKAGILAHLEGLEAQMSRPCKRSKELQQARAEESALGTKIHELRRLRDKLRAEVNQQRARGKASSANVESGQTVEIGEQEVLERKQESVKAILQAYRFTGLSGKQTSRGVCVCISTAFEGNLLDSYFVDLVIQRPLWIHHHSIPVFIPLEKIAAKYLQTDVQRFLFSLCESLNAYAGRKYQADRLQSDFAAFLIRPLQRNSLCNLLSFTYKVDLMGQSSFCARLLYKDLTATLPTDATVTYQGTEALSALREEQRASHEALFCTKPLHQVFASFAREEELDLSLAS
ncbi:Centromere protein O [Heterocephalus glaber]|uniref:Centromere protein O n=1 Tax=Heterocephalus glaber TaxID=10181 RepID=G5CBJ7_HETGA|nr:centromere protein O isoform X2 [Heterocephalus glaber]EHB18925.1 Centromere protein O [Heterocephalus glaber]